MAKKGKTKFAILGMLALNPESSGYDIKKMIETSIQYCWKESFGSIYPVLSELENEKLIKQVKPAQISGRQKNLYSLTVKGRQTFVQWMEEPVEQEQPRNELLLKLFFGQTVPTQVMKKHLEKYGESLRHKLAIFEEIKKMLEKEQKNDPGFPYWIMSLDYGFHQVKSALSWTEKALKRLPG